MLICACTARPLDSDCESPELPPKTCNPQCAGCWSEGDCILDINHAGPDELEVMLVYALSSSDEDQAFCETRSAAEAIAAQAGFSKLEEVRDLALQHDVEVRVNGHCIGEEPFPGVTDIATVSPSHKGATCCVDGDCDDKAFICDATAVDEFPTRCERR